MMMKGSKVTFCGISFFLWYMFWFNYINRQKTWMHHDCISFTKNCIYQAFWCNFQIGNRIFSLEIMSFSYVTVPVKHPVEKERQTDREGERGRDTDTQRESCVVKFSINGWNCEIRVKPLWFKTRWYWHIKSYTFPWAWEWAKWASEQASKWISAAELASEASRVK